MATEKSFWILRDASSVTDEEMKYDTSSRIEPKRSHHWFSDASEQESFSNKKQAIEVANSRHMPGNSGMNISHCKNTSSFHLGSSLFSGRSCGSDPITTFSCAGTTMSSVAVGNSNMERKGFEDQFQNNSSAGLSMFHAIENPFPFRSYGVRKVKVNQVTDCGSDISASIGNSCGSGGSHAISLNTSTSKNENTISLGQTCNEEAWSTSNKPDENFISMGHVFNKLDGSFMFMGHHYNKADGGILSTGQPFDNGDGNFVLADQRYEKGNDNMISADLAYKKGLENFISMGITYNDVNENFISMGPTFDKLGDTRGATHNQISVVSMSTPNDKGDSSIRSIAHLYNKGDSTLSFGGFQGDVEANNLSGRIFRSPNLLTSQPPVQPSKARRWEDSVEHNTDPNLSAALVQHNALAKVSAASVECNADPNASAASVATLKTKAVPRTKEKKASKKISPNSFPSNVKSLLATGILDGVPVKYVSWSREKNLRGLIKGTAYLCGCENCKLSKALTAYEFELHADCKTKHPNDHIFFENGKSVYAVVQELRSTPQEMLFEAIQSVTGSPINQKNFYVWKASFEAATNELQRIYGKDEVKMPS